MRTRTRAIAAATAVAALGGAGIPALTGAQTTGERELTLRGKVVAGAEVKQGRGEALATGDALIVRLRFSDATGAPAGTAYSECTNVGPRARPMNAVLQCTQTYDLRDGQIVTSGVVRFSAPPQSLAVPIVGGSGAYRGARGQLTAGTPVRGFDTVDVLHIDG
jgi:hypothetical protein